MSVCVRVTNITLWNFFFIQHKRIRNQFYQKREKIHTHTHKKRNVLVLTWFDTIDEWIFLALKFLISYFFLFFFYLSSGYKISIETTTTTATTRGEKKEFENFNWKVKKKNQHFLWCEWNYHIDRRKKRKRKVNFSAKLNCVFYTRCSIYIFYSEIRIDFVGGSGKKVIILCENVQMFLLL